MCPCCCSSQAVDVTHAVLTCIAYNSIRFWTKIGGAVGDARDERVLRGPVRLQLVYHHGVCEPVNTGRTYMCTGLVALVASLNQLVAKM